MVSVAAVTSGSISDGSIFGGLVGGFGVLVAMQFGLAKVDTLRPSIILVSIAGLTICAVGMVFKLPVLELAALVLLVGGLAATAITFKRGPLPAPLTSRLPRGLLGNGAVVFAVLILAVGIGFAAGFFIGGSGSSPTTVVAAPGRFHIRNTCYDGVCTVNVCETPKVCGEDNVGELREGTAIEIECQTIGGLAHGSRGEGSRVWDRLSSGFYVSDLFVGETNPHRLTRKIARCTNV